MAISDAGDFAVVSEYCSAEYESYDRGCYYAGIGGSRTTKDAQPLSFNVVSQRGYKHREHTHSEPDVSVNAAGEFVVVWQRTSNDSGDADILARQFQASTVASGRDYVVNDASAAERCCADAVRLSNGTVVVWESQEEDGDGAGIFAKRLP